MQPELISVITSHGVLDLEYCTSQVSGLTITCILLRHQTVWNFVCLAHELALRSKGYDGEGTNPRATIASLLAFHEQQGLRWLLEHKTLRGHFAATIYQWRPAGHSGRFRNIGHNAGTAVNTGATD